ncbi:MAG: glycosyltransferase family 32 protein [Janthinobacterium lividum]
MSHEYLPVAGNRGRTESPTPRLPMIEFGKSIPKLIHQTFPCKTLPVTLQKNVENLISLNPGWQHQIYDDHDIKNFVMNAYGAEIYKYFDKINPRYGAAKADLFRYLLLYKYGGVYLDIKSTCLCPFEEFIFPDDRLLLSHWDNESEGPHFGWGKVKELENIKRGEYQQ